MSILANPLFSTAVGGILVVVFQRGWKNVGFWQDRRNQKKEDAKDVDVKDHELLHEMAEVMMDKPAGVFTRGSKGLVTRFGVLETNVSDIQTNIQTILERLDGK